MLTVTFILIVVALLFGAGAIPSRLLFPDEGSALRCAASPVLGFALLTMAVQTLYLLGVTVRRQAPILVLAIVALALADWLWRTRHRSNAGETERGSRPAVLACGAAAVIMCGWPGIYAGHQTYMAYANPDANNYQFVADRYLNHPRSEAIVLDGFHPGNYIVSQSFQLHMRSGVEAFLAWVSAVCGTNTKQAYWIAVCSMVFLIPLSVYVFVLLGLDADRRVAIVAAGLMATSSLVGLLAFQELLGNLGGAAVMPAALGCILASLRRVRFRSCVAAAVLCAALLSLYPEMFGLLGPAVVGATIAMACQFGITRIARRAFVSGIGVAAATLLINPVFGYYGLLFIVQQSRVLAGGYAYAFAFTTAILPVAFGLLPSPAATAGGGLLIQAFRILAYMTGAVCVISLGQYAFRRLKDGTRPPLLGALAAMLALAATMAFGRHYSYGFFKVILYGEFLLVTGLAAWALGFWNEDGRSRNSLARWATAAILLGIAGFNAVSLVWYGAASLGRQQYGIVNEAGLSEDPSFDELEGLRHMLAPTDSVMVDANTGIDQMWAAFGMRDIKISLIQPLSYFELWTRYGGADFTHDYSDRYVLTGSAAHRDIIDWHAKDSRLWKSSRFDLYPFRDFVAVGSNWYDLNNDPYPWRWLNNDGEILLIRPSERRYRIVFNCSPGPGVKDSVRHMKILVNGTGVFEQVTDGPSVVTSTMFPVDDGINRIKVHIAEQPSLIVTDTRLLNVAVSQVKIMGERAVQQAIDEQNPTEITLQSLPKNLEAMSGIYSDTWVGPKADLWLGSRTDSRQLEIDGEIPVWEPLQLPLRIRVSANGVHLGEVSVTAKGTFKGVVQVPPVLRKQSRLHVSLMSDQSFTGQQFSHSNDTRPLTFFFRAVRLRPATAVN
jgi:hypothetical protein